MASPPSKSDLLELFRRLVPQDFSGPIEADESFALFRGLADQFARLAQKGAQGHQGAYFLPHASQSDIPATSAIRASGNATLARTGDLNRHLIINPRELRLQGRGGRFFHNLDTIEWLPLDPTSLTREVAFESEVPGYAGNLEHLSDPSGNLPLDRIAIADQAQQRANTEGSVVSTGLGTVIQDSGIPDLFDPADVGLYVLINLSSAPANTGRLLKITGFDFPEDEIPFGSGRFPRRVFVDENELVAPREVFQDDDSAGTQVDYTAESKNDTVDDIVPFPSPPAVDDAMYVAALHPISGVRVAVTTAAVQTAGSIVWEYWNGSAWAALTVLDDPSDLFTAAGDHLITWEVPTDMATSVSLLSGITWHHVRARVTGAPVFTTEPLFGRVIPRQFRALVPEVGTLTWSLLDFAQNDLGLDLHSAQAFSGGRDDDLFLLGDGRGVYQQDGESDDTFRNRVARLLDTVSPNAILRVVNRALRPFGSEGMAIDVDNGLTGLFMDVDFYDYFTAGDTTVSHGTARVVSTSNIAALTGTPVIDGVATVSGDVVLLVAQSTASENGAYITDAGAWSRDPAWGFGSGTGALHFITAVSEGTSFAGSTWLVNAGDSIGVDSLTIPQLTADSFPVDPLQLLLSYDEAYGHFLVIVPYLDHGEFGFSLDDGPTVLLDDEGVFLGPSFGSFFDGDITQANSLYGAIYSSVDAIRAGGVGFTMIRDERANDLAAC